MQTEKERVWRRAYNKRTNYAAYHKYEKTKKGFLMRCYRNMESRISGIQWKKAHLYKGKELLDRDTFYEWSNASDSFHTLFDDWELTSYDRKLTPSINRINPDKGYMLGNMEWITHSENSRRTSRWGYNVTLH